MTKEELYIELEKNNIKLNNIQKEQLDLYAKFLMEYNSHTNLTAIKDEEGIYLKHFYDSASICFNYDFSNKSILDIGTGAGFPGMIIKIIYPTTKITLLDSNNKKTKFLEELKTKLNIDVLIINNRVENLSTEIKYDYVVSRAVSELRILTELSLPFLKLNGYMLCQKSHVEEEIQNAKDTVEIMGAKIEKIDDLQLVDSLGKRCIVVIKKEKETPKTYPRKYDKILKYPLKKNNK